MKAISLHQPWASALAIGLKHWETRGRPTHIRGPIAIHAAKKNTSDLEAIYDELLYVYEIRRDFSARAFVTFEDTIEMDFKMLPFGAILATAELTDCLPTEVSLLRGLINPVEHAIGNYLPGRFAWKLENVRALAKPIPFKGRQGWFEIPDSLLAA